MHQMNIGDQSLLSAYLKKTKALKTLCKSSNFKKLDLSFLINASSVFSSNIEGNTTDLNSFMNYKMGKGKIKSTKEIREIEDLVEAYEFAMKHDFSERGFLKIHAILSKGIVSKSRQGKYRQEKVGVFDKHGLVYMAALPELLVDEMKGFCLGVNELMEKKLSLEEAFYFASQAHLIFAHIHPFIDGNGRAARLLEKWFLSYHLGENAWKIASEEFYWKNRTQYYKNINLGVNYFELDYSGALPFLLMLPGALG